MKVSMSETILKPFILVVALIKKTYKNFFKQLTEISVESIGWIGVAALHVATIPGLLAVMSGLSDDTPNIDMSLLLWTALMLFFLKALLKKDMVMIFIITMGFIVQCVVMALIFFK